MLSISNIFFKLTKSSKLHYDYNLINLVVGDSKDKFKFYFHISNNYICIIN